MFGTLYLRLSLLKGAHWTSRMAEVSTLMLVQGLWSVPECEACRKRLCGS